MWKRFHAEYDVGVLWPISTPRFTCSGPVFHWLSRQIQLNVGKKWTTEHLQLTKRCLAPYFGPPGFDTRTDIFVIYLSSRFRRPVRKLLDTPSYFPLSASWPLSILNIMWPCDCWVLVLIHKAETRVQTHMKIKLQSWRVDGNIYS